MAVTGECRDESIIRKVDKMNEDYILRDGGAVLNWFDITEIEGKCSLNDNIGDVLKSFRGKLWFAKLFLILAKKMGSAEKKPSDKSKEKSKKTKKKNAASGMDKNTMNLISGLTVLRFTSMLGMRNVYFTKDELLKLNKQLNKISKK